MKNEYLEPARSVIAAIGVKKSSEVTGKHISRVYCWMYPRERGGTGGFIPQIDAAKLLAYAQSEGLDVSAEDFFRPREPVQ